MPAVPVASAAYFNEQGFIPIQLLTLEEVRELHRMSRMLLADKVHVQNRQMPLADLIVRTKDPLQDRVNYPNNFVMGNGTPAAPVAAGTVGGQGLSLGWSYVPIARNAYEQFFSWQPVAEQIGVLSLGVIDAGDPIGTGGGIPGTPPRLASVQMRDGAGPIERLDVRQLYAYGESPYGHQGYWQKNYTWLEQERWFVDHLYEDVADNGDSPAAFGINTPHLAYLCERYGKFIAVKS